MDSSNYKWYSKLALAVRADDFRIEDNLGERMHGLAHLVSEMGRYSSHGLGGAAFRHWVSGVFRDGVYVFADNYRVGLSFASDPAATAVRGCQESRVNGNPWPQLSEGCWINLAREDVPDSVRQTVLRIANELIREAALDVFRRAEQLQAEEDATRKQRTADHDAMVVAWTEAAP